MWRVLSRIAVAATLGTTATVACNPSLSSPQPGSAAVDAATNASVWTDVSVATLWTSPRAPRAVDTPALGDPVDLPGWLAAMDVPARRGLVGRVATQTLLGERLLVVLPQDVVDGSVRRGCLIVGRTPGRSGGV